MTRNEFIMHCASMNILPAIALEEEAIREALRRSKKDGNDLRVINELLHHF